MDQKQINIQMPEAYRLRVFDVLDSTNKEAIRAAEKGEGGNLWITAESQSSGKGRRGREWVSSEGNLFCSLLLKNRKDALTASQLSFAAALAVYDTAAEILGSAENIQCKWPNDILVKNQKISGILLESSGFGNNAPEYIIIGIGLNLSSHPKDALYPATDFKSLGKDASPKEAIAVLAKYMAEYIRLWHEDGFDPIRKKWLKQAKGQRSEIIVKLPSEEIIGCFVDLDPSGALMLQTDKGLRLITAGDVFFPELAAE